MKLIEFKIETQVGKKKIYRKATAVRLSPSTVLHPFVSCYLVHLGWSSVTHEKEKTKQNTQRQTRLLAMGKKYIVCF